MLMLSSNGDEGEMGGDETAPEVITSRMFVCRLVAQASSATGGGFP